jgi:hypothetical protein
MKDKMMEKKKRGRPKKEDTKVISFRVSKKNADKLKILIKKMIDKSK